METSCKAGLVLKLQMTTHESALSKMTLIFIFESISRTFGLISTRVFPLIEKHDLMWFILLQSKAQCFYSKQKHDKLLSPESELLLYLQNSCHV